MLTHNQLIIGDIGHTRSQAICNHYGGRIQSLRNRIISEMIQINEWVHTGYARLLYIMDETMSVLWGTVMTDWTSCYGRPFGLLLSRLCGLFWGDIGNSINRFDIKILYGNHWRRKLKSFRRAVVPLRVTALKLSRDTIMKMKNMYIRRLYNQKSKVNYKISLITQTERLLNEEVTHRWNYP